MADVMCDRCPLIFVSIETLETRLFLFNTLSLAGEIPEGGPAGGDDNGSTTSDEDEDALSPEDQRGQNKVGLGRSFVVGARGRTRWGTH